jgi:hypothetical protein
MDARHLLKVGLKAAASLLGGGLCYAVWLAAFLLVEPLESAALDTALWILAPIVAAAGFAAGLLVYARLAGERREPFLRAMAWPLAGCVAGALVAYWIGPMLIVFTMLWAGALSVALREVNAPPGGGQRQRRR